MFAQRRYLQPCTGGQDQQLQSRGVHFPGTFAACVRIHQRCYLLLEHQGQQQHPAIRGCTKLVNKPRLDLIGLSAASLARLQGLLGQTRGHIQSDILNRILIALAESAPLPTGRRARLHNEQSPPPAVMDELIQQGPQDFTLRVSRLDGGYCIKQLC